MKNRIILFLIASFSVGTAYAQDRIHRTDGTIVEARVTEVTPEEIRYKRFSNPDGPTYVLPVSNVRSILYPNGEEDVFEAYPDEPAASSTAVSVTAVISTVPTAASVESRTAAAGAETPKSTTEESLRVYAVGDYYEAGPVRGVVAAVFDEGRHGLIFSLDEAALPWCTLPKSGLGVTGASAANDGEANVQAVERFIARNQLSWEQFPAFDWCRGQGEGWYLPSIDEMLRICADYNGGTRLGNNREARNRFNDTMRQHGGKRMDRLAYYLSSTERDAKSVVCTHVGLEPPFTGDISKNIRFLVRAVRKF